jgi:hypothetical protein
MLLWFTSYLIDRTQQVETGNCFSSIRYHRPTVVIPKCFINDTGLKFRSLHCLFADDLKLYRIIRYQTDMVELQLDLNDLKIK